MFIMNLHYMIMATSYQLRFKTPDRTYQSYDCHYEMFLRVDTSSDRRHLNETDLRPKFKLMFFLYVDVGFRDRNYCQNPSKPFMIN